VKVLFAEEVIDDLVDLHGFLAIAESLERADAIVSDIQESCRRRAKFPDQGHVPPELDGYKTKHREIHCKVWRIIYRIDAKKLYILAVVDSRRDVQSFLERRLLR